MNLAYLVRDNVQYVQRLGFEPRTFHLFILRWIFQKKKFKNNRSLIDCLSVYTFKTKKKVCTLFFFKRKCVHSIRVNKKTREI